ncbi:hypothetical protein evm_014625 [Chilo suppressalis]|nr:hypothetical protein evm_014625 [Chilo suppressalis]
MSHFDGKRRAFCVRAFYENSRSYVVVRRLFCSEYGVRQIREAPSANLIKIWIKRFEETGSTFKPHAKGRPRTSRTEDNIESVKQSVREYHTMSTRKRSSVLNISRRSLQRILNLDLKLHPYKLQLTQELKDSDFIARLTFANEMLNRFSNFENILFSDFSNFENILFSDEAHFHMNGSRRIFVVKWQQSHNAALNAPSKTKKTQTEHCKEYQQKSRLKRHRVQLDALLFEKSEAPQSKNIKLIDIQNVTNKKFIMRHNEISTDHIESSKELLHDTDNLPTQTQESSQRSVINLPFQAPYEQHTECSKPNAILQRLIDIPGDGNCLFYSIIEVLRLRITPSELRKKLLESRYFHTCQNPNNARFILVSESEFGDLDCLSIFSKEYNQNICVHFYFFNTNTRKEKVWFCYFIVNDTQNFIHLHLRNQHFTPYIEVQEMIIHNSINSQQPIETQDMIMDNNISSQHSEDCIFEDPSNFENNTAAEENSDARIEFDDENNVIEMEFIENDVAIPVYTNYYQHSSSHLDFVTGFKKNTFGHSCAVCDRLWWVKDLSQTSSIHENILQKILPNYVCGTNVDICSTCKAALSKEKIPLMATYNGFSYPIIPSDLPTLNLVEQRLISPRIPFMQIRRLRHVHGQYGIYGQIINVPIEVNTMVNHLPRNINDDHCVYVHLKKKLVYKSSYVHGLINLKNIKKWLTYLVKTPLYIYYNITIDNTFLNNNNNVTAPELVLDDVSEHVAIEDNLTAQQQTLMWNQDLHLHMAPGEKSIPISILFDEHAEELSFPTIYGGQFRTYREDIHVTEFMQAASEIRRTDRRATDPQHLLYLAAKIMRLRVSQSIRIAFKHVGYDTKITKENVQSEEYINNCIESNLAFLRCIPNSAWYWSDRKKDLFAMIRQLGAPTAFMTVSANETGWTDLLKLLYKLKNNGADISNEHLAEMSYIDKATLVNEDAVTCAIYFNKLVDCLLKILQSKKRSPFGKHRS